MRIAPRILVVVAFALAFASQGHSANCRSGDAAARGGEAGFQRDKKAAEQMAKDESNKSETLAKCLGSITAVITTPQFPSLANVYDQLKKKVCKIARDQINGAVRTVNDRVQDEIDSTINDPVDDAVRRADGVINDAARDLTDGRVSNPNFVDDAVDRPRVSAPGARTTTDLTTGTDFWRKIWN